MNRKLQEFAKVFNLPVGELPKTQHSVCFDCANYSKNIPQYNSREPFCGMNAPQLIIKGLCPAHTPLNKRI